MHSDEEFVCFGIFLSIVIIVLVAITGYKAGRNTMRHEAIDHHAAQYVQVDPHQEENEFKWNDEIGK